MVVIFLEPPVVVFDPSSLTDPPLADAPSSSVVGTPLPASIAAGEQLSVRWIARDSSGRELGPDEASVENFEVSVEGSALSRSGGRTFQFAFVLPVRYDFAEGEWVATTTLLEASLAFPAAAAAAAAAEGQGAGGGGDPHVLVVNPVVGASVEPSDLAFTVRVLAGVGTSAKHVVAGGSQTFYVAPGAPDAATSTAELSDAQLVAGDAGKLVRSVLVALRQMVSSNFSRMHLCATFSIKWFPQN